MDTSSSSSCKQSVLELEEITLSEQPPPLEVESRDRRQSGEKREESHRDESAEGTLSFYRLPITFVGIMLN